MKILLTIIISFGLIKTSTGSCIEDNRTLTEMLFKGQVGAIFSCKILTSTTTKNEDIISTAEIIQVYFGTVDTTIITLNTGNYNSSVGGKVLQVSKTYLIYSAGKGKSFGCCNICDRWTKQITDSPDSTYEVQLIKQFSDIFINKTSATLILKNSKGIVIAEGEYKKGKPVKVWKHYYDNAIIKAAYDFDNNITSQYSANGFIKDKSKVNKNIGIYEQYSQKVNGQLYIKDIETQNDTGFTMQVYEYNDNGKLMNVRGQININVEGGSTSAGKTGIYEEYYENGNIKLTGQYLQNKQVGLWKSYKENGELISEINYKDGSGEQK